MMSSQESTTRKLWPPLRYEVPAWTHFLWLIYLGFLFTPLLSSHKDWRWLWPTLLSLPVFLALYTSVIFKFRRSNPPGAAALPEILAMGAMGFLLAPVNESANTYIIYCIAVASFVIRGFRRLALFVIVLLSAYALELAWLGFDPMLFGITTVVALASGTSNYMMLQNRLRNLALQRSGEEVHRLARLAERERIGRDLHDLLGHTLSLIAIKSELAAKLMDRDRAAAGREVTEVMNIARDALRQVRTAVTGIRSAAFEGEMASARAMLDTAGVMLKYERDGTVLPPEVETTLAMIVREAVTNIQRHSCAGAASIQVLLDEGGAERAVLLQVSDDGRGGITAPGNGLAGIRERVQSLGGKLEIESPRGGGTVLRVRVPLGAPAVVAVAAPVGQGPSVAGEGVLTAGSDVPVRGPSVAQVEAGALAAGAGVLVAGLVDVVGRSGSVEVAAGGRDSGRLAMEPGQSGKPAASVAAERRCGSGEVAAAVRDSERLAMAHGQSVVSGASADAERRFGSEEVAAEVRDSERLAMAPGQSVVSAASADAERRHDSTGSVVGLGSESGDSALNDGGAASGART